MKKHIIMAVEPSKRLSKMLGFPYYIEKRFTLEELLSQGIIDASDIERLEKGEQIHKKLPVNKSS